MEEAEVEGEAVLQLEEVGIIRIVACEEMVANIFAPGRGGFQRDNGPPSAVLGESLSSQLISQSANVRLQKWARSSMPVKERLCANQSIPKSPTSTPQYISRIRSEILIKYVTFYTH